jgi:hypothetical protein
MMKRKKSATAFWLGFLTQSPQNITNNNTNKQFLFQFESTVITIGINELNKKARRAKDFWVITCNFESKVAILHR